MIERRCGPGFPHEASHPLGVADETRGQEFQRDFSRQPGILGQVHLAHATRPELAKDAIGADNRARADAHTDLSQVA
jgi:hypothetical protein